MKSPLHIHAYHSERVYILSGSGEFVLNDKATLVSKGGYLFIPLGSEHSVAVTSSDPVRVLSIQCPEFTAKDRIKVPYRPLHCKDSSNMSHTFQQIAHFINKLSSNYRNRLARLVIRVNLLQYNDIFV